MSWGGVKKQTNIENIKAWCEEMGIENYIVKPNGEIDVNGKVDLSDIDFKELPYKFGRVKGYFSLTSNRNLTSLKNCPNHVDIWFACDNCKKLDSLEGCPKKVRGNFWCENCKRKFTEKEIRSLCKVGFNIYN